MISGIKLDDFKNGAKYTPKESYTTAGGPRNDVRLRAT
jgi:hypothetical protein